MNRPLASGLWLAVLALTACVKVERETGYAPLHDARTVASGRVLAAEGGIVAPPEGSSLHRGVRIEFPPGALPEDTDVEIVVRYGDERFPSIVQEFLVRPEGLALLAPAKITIEYSEVYAAMVGQLWSEGEILVYSFVDGPEVDECAHPIEARDTERNMVVATTERLGTFFGLHEPLRALVDQPTRLVDPAAPLHAEMVQGQLRRSANGPVPVPIGKGDLQAFWSAPADRNLLVLPGLLTDPIALSTPNSLVPDNPRAGLNQDFDNVVVLQYPSGRSIRETANTLYDTIRADAQAGFGCQILAHGTGGLVARYAIERSHADPIRAGHRPGDPPLGSLIPRVVIVGTPNQGAPAVQSQFAGLLSIVLATDLPFVQGVVDLLPGTDSFVASLNRFWQQPESVYYAIAGDVGGARSDGLVDVLSAVGVPASFSRPEAYQVFSGPIYDHASLAAFADRTGVVAQAREWFDKLDGTSAPIVGSVQTPPSPAGGVVEVPYSVSDAQRDVCFVTALYSRDGNSWRVATSADGRQPIAVRSLAAPGETHLFRWDTAADSVGTILGADRVIVRFLVADQSAVGVPGETGSFVVFN